MMSGDHLKIDGQARAGIKTCLAVHAGIDLNRMIAISVIGQRIGEAHGYAGSTAGAEVLLPYILLQDLAWQKSGIRGINLLHKIAPS